MLAVQCRLDHGALLVHCFAPLRFVGHVGLQRRQSRLLCRPRGLQISNVLSGRLYGRYSQLAVREANRTVTRRSSTVAFGLTHGCRRNKSLTGAQARGFTASPQCSRSVSRARTALRTHTPEADDIEQSDRLPEGTNALVLVMSTYQVGKFGPQTGYEDNLELREDGGVVLRAQLDEAPPQLVSAAAQLRRVLLRARAAQLLLLSGARRLVQLLPAASPRGLRETVNLEAA